MPAPTALLQKEAPSNEPNTAFPQTAGADQVMLLETEDNDILEPTEPLTDTNDVIDAEMIIEEESRPRFAAAKDVDGSSAARRETRKVTVPPHRMAPLKVSWPKIYPPLVEHLKLQVRLNIKAKAVEMRSSQHTTEVGALQKAEDFVRAFCLGFDVEDAVAILRLEGIYVQTFEIKDVKTLEGDHKARAIGRVAGKDGKTKNAIESTTRTRIVVAGSKISILGGFKEIGMARESIVSLILGKPPGKVYGNLRSISSRMKERF